MRIGFLVALVLLAVSVHGLSADFRFPQAIAYNEWNVFSLDVDCNKVDANNLAPFTLGQFVDYRIFVCADGVCSEADKGVFVLENYCFFSKDFIGFVPPDTFNVGVGVAMKKHTDTEYKFFKSAVFERNANLQNQNPNAVVENSSDAFPVNWVFVAVGIILFLAGFLAMRWKFWFGLLVVVIGIGLIISSFTIFR